MVTSPKGIMKQNVLRYARPLRHSWKHWKRKTSWLAVFNCLWISVRINTLWIKISPEHNVSHCIRGTFLWIWNFDPCIFYSLPKAQAVIEREEGQGFTALFMALRLHGITDSKWKKMYKVNCCIIVIIRLYDVKIIFFSLTNWMNKKIEKLKLFNYHCIWYCKMH